MGHSSPPKLFKITRMTDKETAEVAPQRVPTTVRDFFFEDPHFKDTWDNFDNIRDSMFKESRDLWKKMDDDFRQVRCMREDPILALDEDMPVANGQPLEKYEKGWMFPRKWMMPSLDPKLGELELFKHGDHEVIRVTDNDEKFEVSLDTSHYRPDELHVHVDNGFITIDGKHEEKSADGKKMLTRRFQRKYTLPEGARSEDVSSNLASDGVLVVKALKAGAIQEVEIKKIE